MSRGGLGVHLALVAMGGETGMDVDLNKVPAVPGLVDSRILYSESAGRFIITVDPAKKARFEELFKGLKTGLVGRVTKSDILRISGISGNEIMSEGIAALKACWLKTFGGLI